MALKREGMSDFTGFESPVPSCEGEDRVGGSSLKHLLLEYDIMVSNKILSLERFIVGDLENAKV